MTGSSPVDLDPQGLLLIGHGTRDERGLDEFAETGRFVQSLLPSCHVETGFLELAQPDIKRAIRQLVERGVDQIVAVPLLLFAASHAKRDIPAAIEDACREWPVRIRVAAPLACHPKLLQLSVRRFREVTGHEPVGVRPVRLVVVGRGSSDDEATIGMQRYAEQLAREVDVDRWNVAFMAMAEPRLNEALRDLARQHRETIVVLPHLLFQGDVLQAVKSQAAACAKDFPATRFLVARHLGPSRLLAEAITDVARLTNHSRSTN